ncbi:MAG: alanine racemase, partial [Flavobacteriaceae bacterium]|nr:alanine racemase [Flavobacteriaceae bacterium]
QKTIKILLQVKIAKEDTKFGFETAELEEILTSDFTSTYPNIQVKGLMGMATLTENKAIIAEEFGNLKKLFDHYKTSHTDFEILSMGMTGDYDIALKEGSTLVRIGSAIFGERNYH